MLRQLKAHGSYERRQAMCTVVIRFVYMRRVARSPCCYFGIPYFVVKATDFKFFSANVTAITAGLHVRVRGKPAVIGTAQ
jgi:hypothetical protein